MSNRKKTSVALFPNFAFCFCSRRKKKNADGDHTRKVNNHPTSDAARNSTEENFDLTANAFPPLPVHNAETTASASSPTTAAVTSSSSSTARASSAAAVAAHSSDNHSNDNKPEQLNGENGYDERATPFGSPDFAFVDPSLSRSPVFRNYRLVPVYNATNVGNKLKTEDTLNSNGVSTNEVDKPLSQCSKVTANCTSLTQTKSGASTEISAGGKRSQVRQAR